MFRIQKIFSNTALCFKNIVKKEGGQEGSQSICLHFVHISPVILYALFCFKRLVQKNMESFLHDVRTLPKTQKHIVTLLFFYW
jgi:hypothetical protein